MTRDEWFYAYHIYRLHCIYSGVEEAYYLIKSRYKR